MVQTLGYAGTGNLSHVGTTPLPGPKPGIRPAHRPWCRDCKRTHDAAQIDDAGRCARCTIQHAADEDRSEIRARVAAQIDAEEKAAARRAAAAGRQQPRTSAPAHTPGLLPSDIGATAMEVKSWAVTAGLLPRVAKGKVAVSVVEAYAAAHDLRAAS